MKAAGTLLEASASPEDAERAGIVASDGAKPYQFMVPLLLQVSADAIEQGQEDAAFHAFDVIGTLASSPTAVLGPYLPKVVEYMVQVRAGVGRGG